MDLWNPRVYDNPNPIYFFTATINSWKLLLERKSNYEVIMKSLTHLVTKDIVYLYGFVLMPHHIHLLWNIRDPYQLPDVQRNFLRYTAQVMKLEMMKTADPFLEEFRSTQRDRKYHIWERNPLSIPCCTRKVVEQKLDYIHRNPLKAKWRLARTTLDYYYSSARFYDRGHDDWGILTH